MAARFPTTRRTLHTAAMIAVIAGGGAHADYRVSAFKNAPGFDAIMEGDYEKANREMPARAPSPEFAADANHCVSQLLVEELTQALSSCNRALRQLPETTPLANRSRRANQSILLTNRGVVLALQGELAAAEEDFARALRLDDENSNAEANLEHVRSLKVSMR